MKIYKVLTEKEAKFIEQALINDWQHIQYLSSKITFNEDRYKPFDYNTPEVIEFRNYCKSHYALLVSIKILLTTVQKNANDIEKAILIILNDYLGERISSIELIIEILDDSTNEFKDCCKEIECAIGDLIWKMKTILPLDEV